MSVVDTRLQSLCAGADTELCMLKSNSNHTHTYNLCPQKAVASFEKLM